MLIDTERRSGKNGEWGSEGIKAIDLALDLRNLRSVWQNSKAVYRTRVIRQQQHCQLGTCCNCKFGGLTPKQIKSETLRLRSSNQSFYKISGWFSYLCKFEKLYYRKPQVRSQLEGVINQQNHRERCSLRTDKDTSFPEAKQNLI